MQRAIEHGDQITGATTFRIVKALDAGPIFGYMTYQVPPRATSGEVLQTLAVDAAPLLVKTLDAIADGSARPEVQSEAEASYASKLTSQDAQIGFDRPALAVDRLIRACTPAPGAWVSFRGNRLGVGPVRLPDQGSDDPTQKSGLVQNGVPSGLQAGQLLATKQAVWVGTSTVPVLLEQVAPAGKAPMAAVAWARGQRLNSEDHF